jgi:hypothetical protein
MALIYTSEYLGDKNKRIAQVFKHSNGTGYTVHCFESTVKANEHQFQTESQADNFAEDWVQEDTASE